MLTNKTKAKETHNGESLDSQRKRRKKSIDLWFRTFQLFEEPKFRGQTRSLGRKTYQNLKSNRGYNQKIVALLFFWPSEGKKEKSERGNMNRTNWGIHNDDQLKGTKNIKSTDFNRTTNIQ